MSGSGAPGGVPPGVVEALLSGPRGRGGLLLEEAADRDAPLGEEDDALEIGSLMSASLGFFCWVGGGPRGAFDRAVEELPVFFAGGTERLRREDEGMVLLRSFSTKCG